VAGIKRESRGIGARSRRTSRAAVGFRDDGGRTCWLLDLRSRDGRITSVIAERAGGDLIPRILPALHHWFGRDAQWVQKEMIAIGHSPGNASLC
jgi:hypothetical protein